MLNFGPRADGTIPEEFASRLREIGSWLKANGEAIYATRPYLLHGEGPTVKTEKNRKKLKKEGYNYTSEDIRFTRSKDGKTLYVIALAWPENGELLVKSLRKGKFDASSILSISQLGGAASVDWKQSAEGLKLTLPAKPATVYAHPFKVVLKTKIPGLK